MIIYKYKLSMVEEQKIKLPRGFKPLRVEFQVDKLCLWALVDPENEEQNYTFFIIGTGQENCYMLPYLNYISTVFDGNFVLHVFVFMT